MNEEELDAEYDRLMARVKKRKRMMDGGNHNDGAEFAIGVLCGTVGMVLGFILGACLV